MRHRDFGEVVEHQVVDRPALDLPARRLEPVAPESLPGRDANDAIAVPCSMCSCVVEVGGKDEGAEVRPGVLQRGAQRHARARRASLRDRRSRRRSRARRRSARRADARSRRASRRSTAATSGGSGCFVLLRRARAPARAPPARPIRLPSRPCGPVGQVKMKSGSKPCPAIA